MKKNTIIILTLILITTLTGCFKGSKKTKSEDNTPQFISSTASYYKNGAAFSNNQSMLFLDFDTMKCSPLCALPNCTHISSSCLSQMIGEESIFYNDYIYFFTSNNGNVKVTPDGNEFYIESKLMKASLDSSETEIVCEFTDCAPIQKYGGYVLNDNELYFVGDDLCPTGNKDTGYSWGTSGGYHFLCSINLDTGEYTNHGSIYDGDKQYAGAAYSSGGDISGIYKNTMYLEYAFAKEYNDSENGSSDYKEQFTYLSFEFDFETKTWKESELPYSRYMNNNTYTYYDFENDLFNVIYKDKELIIPSEHEIVNCSEFNGKLFMPSEGKWYDLSDCSEHSMGEYEGYNVIAYHDNSYILRDNGLTAKITEEELLTLE